MHRQGGKRGAFNPRCYQGAGQFFNETRCRRLGGRYGHRRTGGVRPVGRRICEPPFQSGYRRRCGFRGPTRSVASAGRCRVRGDEHHAAVGVRVGGCRYGTGDQVAVPLAFRLDRITSRRLCRPALFPRGADRADRQASEYGCADLPGSHPGHGNEPGSDDDTWRRGLFRCERDAVVLLTAGQGSRSPGPRPCQVRRAAVARAAKQGGDYRRAGWDAPLRATERASSRYARIRGRRRTDASGRLRLGRERFYR